MGPGGSSACLFPASKAAASSFRRRCADGAFRRPRAGLRFRSVSAIPEEAGMRDAIVSVVLFRRLLVRRFHRSFEAAFCTLEVGFHKFHANPLAAEALGDFACNAASPKGSNTMSPGSVSIRIKYSGMPPESGPDGPSGRSPCNSAYSCCCFRCSESQSGRRNRSAIVDREFLADVVPDGRSLAL